MNVCQYCGAAATVHLTDVVNKAKRTRHLCEACARQHDLFPVAPGPQLNLTALIQLVLGGSPGGPAPAALICPACGLEYAQFRADGRLGCPADYDSFKDTLEPLLERVHRGLAHVGKVPRAVRRDRHESELSDLRERLSAAVAAEQYEEAARLRDDLRAREKEAAE